MKQAESMYIVYQGYSDCDNRKLFNLIHCWVRHLLSARQGVVNKLNLSNSSRSLNQFTEDDLFIQVSVVNKLFFELQVYKSTKRNGYLIR